MLLTDKNGSQIYLIFILISGAKDKKFYTSIREHPFFTGLDFENLQRHAPAALDTFVKDGDVPDPIWSKCTDLKTWTGERRILDVMIGKSSSDDELEGTILPNEYYTLIK